MGQSARASSGYRRWVGAPINVSRFEKREPDERLRRLGTRSRNAEGAAGFVGHEADGVQARVACETFDLGDRGADVVYRIGADDARGIVERKP